MPNHLEFDTSESEPVSLMAPTCFDRVAVPVVMENTEPGKTCGEAEQKLNRNLVAAFIKISVHVVSDPLHLDPERGLASFK